MARRLPGAAAHTAFCLLLAAAAGACGSAADLPDDRAPDAPAGLTAFASAGEKVELSWAASSDNVGVEGYYVYRDGAQVADAGTTTYSDTGLSASTTYSYTVAAYDAAGNVSAQSAPASATTGGDTGTGNAITVNGSNPRWLYYQDGSPYYLAGSGGPEGFLYLGSRQSDGTRSGGGQQTLIDDLAAAGVNGLYLMAVRSDGGDGGPSENPWVDSDPASGLDGDILNQWEGWFDAMDAAGITIFFILYDDSADPFGGSSMGGEEEAFVSALVDRFKHHDYLIWVVAEEYAEDLSTTRASQVAAKIRAHDPVHPIAIHQNASTTFDFRSDPNFDQFAMQAGDLGVTAETPDQLHSVVVSAWSNAGGAYNVNMAELNNTLGHGEHATAEIRQFNWAAALGGGYVMVYRWWEPNAPSTTELEQLGFLQAFMESTRFDLTEPADSRSAGDTEWVLAHRAGLGNDHFIGYGRSVSTGLGFTGLDAATYDLLWMDTQSGATVTGQQTVPVPGTFTFARPSALSGSELALYAQKSSLP